MRQLARLYLTIGLFIMMLAVVVAVMAMPDGTRGKGMFVVSTDDCLYCHSDVHPDWKINPLPADSYHSAYALQTPQPEDTAAFCSNCHALEDTDHFPWEVIQTRIDSTRTRVEVLKLDIAALIYEHPGWRTVALYAEKTQAQIDAERVLTLIGFIEADGSWGIHDPEYTDAILTEAERLMAELQLN